MSKDSDIVPLREAVATGQIQWHRHALERMLERGITRSDVIKAINNGGVIEVYPTDLPHPSALVLYMGNGPLHVVVSVDTAANICHIVTAYEPDLAHFEADFKTRKKHNE